MATPMSAARPLVEVKALTGPEARRLAPRLVGALVAHYGEPAEPTPREEPIEVLVEAALEEGSRRTDAARAMRDLERAFVDLNELRVSRPGEVQAVLEPLAGAAERAERLVGALNSLFADRGVLSLAFLHEMSRREAEEYLARLDGVTGEMIARVLYYALGHPAIPTSPHIARVSARVGLVPAEATADEMRRRLEWIVPVGKMRAFHDRVNDHGRRTCLVSQPRCRSCPILALCRTGQSLLRPRKRRTGPRRPRKDKKT